MDHMENLIECHLSLRKIEKELKKLRVTLINENGNHSSSMDNHLEYISKWKCFAGFAVEFNNKTAIFDKLIKESIMNKNNNSNNSNNDNDEIITNYPDSSSSGSSNSSDLSYQQLVRSSQPIDTNDTNEEEDELQQHSSTVHIACDKQDKVVESVQEQQTFVPSPEPQYQEAVHEDEEKLPSIMNEENVYSVEGPQSFVPSPIAQSHEADESDESCHNEEKEEKYPAEEWPSLTNGKLCNKAKNEENVYSEQQQKTKRKRVRKRVRTIVVNNSGYKYSGSSYKKWFSGFKNQSTPIYSTMTLFCGITCKNNENDLKKYLIKYGKFALNEILNIEFRSSQYISSSFSEYAIIRIKGGKNKLKNIVKKMNLINKKEKKRVIYQYKKSINYWNGKENNSLFITNFDITDISTHYRFTKLFMSYGNLLCDIIINKNKYGEPFAVVKFENIEDAKTCFNYNNGEIKFGQHYLFIDYAQPQQNKKKSFKNRKY